MQEEMEPSMWWFLRRQKEAGHRISVVCVCGGGFSILIDAMQNQLVYIWFGQVSVSSAK